MVAPRSISGTAARVHKNIPVRLMSMIARQTSSGVSTAS
jgi:hypothetical protein